MDKPRHEEPLQDLGQSGPGDEQSPFPQIVPGELPLSLQPPTWQRQGHQASNAQGLKSAFQTPCPLGLYTCTSTDISNLNMIAHFTQAESLFRMQMKAQKVKISCTLPTICISRSMPWALTSLLTSFSAAGPTDAFQSNVAASEELSPDSPRQKAAPDITRPSTGPHDVPEQIAGLVGGVSEHTLAHS